MKACLAATAAVSLLLTPVAAFAQAAAPAYASAPDLPYEAVPNFFKMPPGDAMGEMQGVARGGVVGSRQKQKAGDEGP